MSEGATGIIQVQNLKKAFGRKAVLNGVNMTLNEGENLVVLGRSGTGKSVLIKCITALIEPDEGEITVDGSNVLAANDKELTEIRRQIGFVFQGAALYDSMTVAENLAFPLRHTKHKGKEVQHMVHDVLENVGLTEVLNKMPAELSGGMKKRIGLARALIMQPKIMLYDEPTTGLDTVTSKEISQLILDVQQKYNTSSIIITHDIPCAKTVADRLLILQDGVFVAEGTYKELEKSDDPEIKAFFE